MENSSVSYIPRLLKIIPPMCTLILIYWRTHICGAALHPSAAWSIQSMNCHAATSSSSSRSESGIPLCLMWKTSKGVTIPGFDIFVTHLFVLLPLQHWISWIIRLFRRISNLSIMKQRVCSRRWLGYVLLNDIYFLLCIMLSSFSFSVVVHHGTHSHETPTAGKTRWDRHKFRVPETHRVLLVKTKYLV